jgi:hypothetical protein
MGFILKHKAGVDFQEIILYTKTPTSWLGLGQDVLTG